MRIIPSLTAITAGFTGADYQVSLPGVVLNLQVPHIISNSRTISRKNTVTVWRGNIAGEERTVNATMDEAAAERLQNIHDSGIMRWTVAAQNRRFECVVSVESLEPIRERPGKWAASIRLVFLSEES